MHCSVSVISPAQHQPDRPRARAPFRALIIVCACQLLEPSSCIADIAPSATIALDDRWELVTRGLPEAPAIRAIATHPEHAAKMAHLDGDLLRALQQAYGFLPAWSVKPKSEEVATGADAWLSLPTEKDLYAERLENALGQMEEVPLSMALTQSLAQRLAPKQPFKEKRNSLIGIGSIAHSGRLLLGTFQIPLPYSIQVKDGKYCYEVEEKLG